MIYQLVRNIKTYIHLYNVISSPAFRAGASLITAFLCSLLGGAWFIARARFFRAGAREYTPESHQVKNNTPTMGGLIIIGAILLATLVWGHFTRPEVLLFFGCLFGFASIGFWDDRRKISGKKGISERAKFIAQVLVGTAVAGAWYQYLEPSTVMHFPFTSWSIDLGYFIIPWACFIIVDCSNAVNLTDGLDGLATELLIRNFGTFALMCYCAGSASVAHYLTTGHSLTAELAVVGAATVGACLGFLWYNVYPARCFMGDVGSLALGSVLAFMALMIRQEFLLIITGLIFVLETLSVFIQVGYYKRYKKRIFKMAPLHHHFELSGWHEATITGRFALITSVLCVIALMIFFA